MINPPWLGQLDIKHGQNLGKKTYWLFLKKK